eukprot:TRINITY_DN354_c0_g1_i2.p5 TRINITY_DN354_c0_g1~~TRINITY_DN354_c0_g1_i2.p5  ORF type:complete len:72 (-),score=11.78 TRINITY_DN354_c0_g1_i2:293-508(-)
MCSPVPPVLKDRTGIPTPNEVGGKSFKAFGATAGFGTAAFCFFDRFCNKEIGTSSESESEDTVIISRGLAG